MSPRLPGEGLPLAGKDRLPSAAGYVSVRMSGRVGFSARIGLVMAAVMWPGEALGRAEVLRSGAFLAKFIGQRCLDIQEIRRAVTLFKNIFQSLDLYI